MSDTKLCPYCGEEIKAIAIKCKICGSMLTPTGTDQPVSSITLVKQALASKYEIIEEIGKGGMATVYRALQKNLHREVALKVIHQNLIHDSEFVARFHREAQVCASLSHPNIVTVYDEGEINGVHFMAMELLSGTDLHRLIHQKGRLEAEEAIRYIAPIAQALDHAHSKGLIHRDVKSSNIIITRDGRSVLTDFGIAHAAAGTKLTQTGTIIGTPEYMSPEQAEGKPLDHRSDIYSLGIVLYECLSGKVPFKGDNPLTTIHKIIYDQPEPLSRISGIPQWIEQIVTQCLEKDVTKRMQSGVLLSDRLKTREIGIQEEDPPLPLDKPHKPSKKNGSTFSLIVKISSFFLLTIFLIPPCFSLPISSDLIGVIVILILTISGLLIFGNKYIRKIVGIISLSALIIGLLSFLVFYFQNNDFTVNKLLGGGEKEFEEKRIADSIRIADSLAMVQAEQQRIAGSIAKAREEATDKISKKKSKKHLLTENSTSDNLDFLMKLNGKCISEVNLLNNTVFKMRLKKIIGSQYDNLEGFMWVQSPIEINNGLFYAWGMARSSGGDPSAVIMADINKNILYVGIQYDYKVTIYSEDGNNAPQRLLDWAGNGSKNLIPLKKIKKAKK